LLRRAASAVFALFIIQGVVEACSDRAGDTACCA
jgi:hypothetical protein